MLIPYGSFAPRIYPGAYVSEQAMLIGSVEVGAGASIWSGAVARADGNSIGIGAGAAILDNCIIHVETPTSRHPHGFATELGEEVLVGPGCVIHGCSIGHESFIGAGAVVMNGCRVEAGAMLASGSLLVPGRIIPSGEMWAGQPARLIRKVSKADIAFVRTTLAGCRRRAQELRSQGTASSAAGGD